MPQYDKMQQNQLKEDKLPTPAHDPEVLAAEIVESLETALEQFKAIYEELGKNQSAEI